MSIYVLIVAVLVSMYSCNSVGQEVCNDTVAYGCHLEDMPSYFVVAGDTVDLTNYENRERLDYELCSFTYSHINTTMSIKRANRYFPVIEKILREENIPDDMKYLAVVESSLNPMARSYVGASGIWQFMEGTAKDFGLRVDKYVDERYDVEKATRAACKYFKQAYLKYGDWLSVSASYNAGQGAITRFRNQQKEKDPTSLWLSLETSRYMFRLIAAKMIFESPSSFGFELKSSDLYPPIEYKIVKIDSDIDSLSVFAKSNGISYYQLKDANPWLRSTSLKCNDGQSYEIKIPDLRSIKYDPRKTKAYDSRWVID